MKKFLRKLPWLLGVVLIATFLIYGFWPKPIKVDTVRVTRGSFMLTIDDDGETRIREKYIVAAPVTGKLLRLQLHAGDIVEQNKTQLVQILPADPTLLDARSQAESEARVQAADAAQDEADATLISAREASVLAQHHYERALQLIGNRSISQAEFDEAEHHARMSESDLRAAEFKAKVKLYERELARAALIRVTDMNEGGNATALNIISPIDGRVLRVLHEDSSVVAAGTALLEIGDPQDLEMVIEVLSSDAVRIQPGAKVIVEHWGGDHPLTGIVRIVEPSAFLKISALGVEEKRVNVIADFVETWEDRKTLGDGFRIEARIVVHATDADSLKVAAGSLFRHGSDWHVYRVQKGKTELVPVKIGATNGQETEILDGLKVEDILVLHPTEQIRSGIQVTNG